MMLFSTHDFLLPQVLWKEKREMFPKKSLQVRKNFTGRSYSLFPLPNTHTKKTFCSPTACCHLGFWSLLQLWTAYPCLRAPQWFSINGLHLGHMSKWLAITSRQTGDTQQEKPGHSYWLSALFPQLAYDLETVSDTSLSERLTINGCLCFFIISKATREQKCEELCWYLLWIIEKQTVDFVNGPAVIQIHLCAGGRDSYQPSVCSLGKKKTFLKYCRL